MSFKNHFGLDIGSTSIKVVQLAKEGNKFKLATFGQFPTPKALDPNAADSDILAISETVKKLIKDCRINTNLVAVALPETQVYTRVIELPVMNEAELTAALKFQVEQYVPLPADEISVKHTLLAGQNLRKDGKMSVLIVASPNYLINRYQSIVQACGLELMAVDTETLCAARALVGSDSNAPTTLLVNIGAAGSDFAVITKGELTASRTINTGGIALTRSVATELGLETLQAEEYKNTYGMDPNQLSGSVAKAMAPVMDLILAELKRVLLTVSNTNPAEDLLVKRIVISGGSALIPGMVSYLAQQLSVEVIVGNPFAQIERSPSQIAAIGESSVIFTNAVGLALKEI